MRNLLIFLTIVLVANLQCSFGLLMTKLGRKPMIVRPEIARSSDLVSKRMAPLFAEDGAW